MTKLRIVCGRMASIETQGSIGLILLVHQDELCVEGKGLLHHWQNNAGDKFIILGNVIGLRQADGTLSPHSFVKLEAERLENPNRIPELEGRFVLVKVSPAGGYEVWADQFGRTNLYWQSVNGAVVLGTGLDLLPVAQKGSLPDSVGVGTYSHCVWMAQCPQSNIRCIGTSIDWG